VLSTAPDAPTDVSAMTATDLPANLVSTLPGQYYTDPAIFWLEQTRVLESVRFRPVRSSERQIGDFHDWVTQRLAD
jgi:hypothetical protein